MNNISWKVFVDGSDMSLAMQPFVISITVQDRDGEASDTCRLEFDDTGGQIELPRDNASVTVFLEGVKVFDGLIDTLASRGSRSGGRVLAVTAKGFDAKGRVKDGQLWHLDDASLKQALEKAAGKAGLDGIRVDERLADVHREYWSPDGASFLAWGQRLAREYNATFKIRGDRAVFAGRGSNRLAPVRATLGHNLISWDIRPVTARRRFKTATARWFDRETGKVETREIEVGQEHATATNAVRTILADRDQAEENLKARKGQAEREGGEGSVELDLTLEAQAEAPFILAGTRPGIDGEYRITSVIHKVTRSQGSTTSLQIRLPETGGAAGEEADSDEFSLGNTPEAQAINEAAQQ